MRLPTPPPEKPPTAEELGKFLLTPSQAVDDFVALANAKYYHWDKLQHLSPPDGMSSAMAWFLVKVSRQAQRRWLPLHDVKRQAFSFSLPNQAQEILHAVDRRGGTLLSVDEDAAAMLGPLREQVIVSSLMEEAIATSQIEGAATTRKVAKEMLRSNRNPRDRSERMIVNSYRTMRLLRDRTNQPLSMELLFEIQESMTLDTLDDASAAGRLRTSADEIQIIDVNDNSVLFTPPEAETLETRMRALIEFANETADGQAFIHPLVKASILHFWLAYEHPFVDGNGRTARALFYWFMLKSGYWLFEFLTVSRSIARARLQYYRSFLYSEHDAGDITYSILFQLKSTLRALRELHDYLGEKQREQGQLVAALRKFPELNHRQRELVGHALSHPEQVYTFQSHARSHDVTLLTARSDLIALLERGLLAESRQGRMRVFFAADDLPAKLSKATSRSRTPSA